MKMSSIDYDKIDRYIEGDMSPEERIAFEELIRQDGSLRKEVELYKEVSESLKTQLHPNEGEKSLRKTLEELRGEFFTAKDVSTKTGGKVIQMNKTRRWLAVAASVAILVVAGIFFLRQNQQGLYEQYAYNNMPAVSERGEPADSLLKLAGQYFNERKFPEALSLFDSALEMDTANSFIRYYHAITLLHLDKIVDARNAFTRLFNGNSTFKYEAAFYMALSFLKEKDKDTTKDWLNRIPVNTQVYERAQKLLDKL